MTAPSLQARFADAVIDDEVEQVRALLDAGADVNAPISSRGETALQYAAELGLAAMATLLLARGAVASLNEDGAGPLHLVAQSPSEDAGECARALLAGGLDVNQRSSGGHTPLSIALYHRRNSLIQAFLDHGALPDRGAMVNAVNVGDHADTLEILIARGGDIHMTGDEDEGLLHMAARARASRILTYLLAQGLDVDALNASGETPLQLALLSGDHFSGANPEREAACCVLLDHGAKPVLAPKGRMTSLMVGARDGLTQLVRAALLRGEPIESRTEMGDTALLLAAWGGHADCVAALLDAGANAGAKNSSRETALEVAEKYACTEAAALLRAHLALQALERGVGPGTGGKLRI